MCIGRCERECCWYLVARSHATLCDLMDYSTPGSSVLHCFPEFAPIHVHWVDEAIQPSHPPLPPSPLAFHLSQHQSFFQWVSSSYQVAKYWSFSFRSVLLMNIQDLFPVGLTSLISLQSKGHSRLFSNTTSQKQKLFGTQLSLYSNSNIHRWLLENHSFGWMDLYKWYTDLYITSIFGRFEIYYSTTHIYRTDLL